jgi:uncharacterized protein YqeY
MPENIESALRVALRAALTARDASSASALRSALAALENAGAVVPTAAQESAATTSPHVAGAVAGLGGSEVPRRQLTPDEQRALVLAEIADRTRAAEQMAHLGRHDDSRRLVAEAEALQRILGPDQRHV